MKFPKLLSTITLAATLLVAGCSSTGSKETALKADAQLAGEIQARLNSDPVLAANQRSSVGVRVQGGVATLSGWVINDQELSAALNAAQGVEGVKQVVSRLQVGQEFAALPSAAPAFADAPEQAEPRYAAPAPRVTRKPAPTRAATRPAPRYEPSITPAVATTQTVSDPYPGTYSQSTSQSTYANAAPAPAAAPAPVEVQRITIPAGTEVPVRLIDTLSSETSNPDQIWRGSVNGDIVVDERVVIPSGADVEGRVVEVKKSTHYTGAAQLTLQLSRVSFGGRNYTVSSDQWTRKGAARGSNTAKKVGTGAAVGAVLGGIFGGGKGAAIGAAAGAGAGAGANTITKGQKVELDSESLLVFHLASSVSVTPQAERERGSYAAPTRQYVQSSRNDDDEDSDRPVLKRR